MESGLVPSGSEHHCNENENKSSVIVLCTTRDLRRCREKRSEFAGYAARKAGPLMRNHDSRQIACQYRARVKRKGCAGVSRHDSGHFFTSEGGFVLIGYPPFVEMEIEHSIAVDSIQWVKNRSSCSDPHVGARAFQEVTTALHRALCILRGYDGQPTKT